MNIKEILTILLAAIILGLVAAFPDTSLTISSIVYFLIILVLNVAAKKAIAYYLESDAETKFWEIYNYGFKQGSHFKKPVPMVWWPIILSLISIGYIVWMPILEFDVQPRVERATKRHGLYRFTNMTDWDISLIASAGILMNLILAIICYITGFEVLAKLAIYFSLWSLVPISSLDGSKILFGSKLLYVIDLVIVLIFFLFTFTVV